MFKPVKKIPFKCPKSPVHFHCSTCDFYRHKNLFFKSYLQRQYRTCAKCHKRLSKSRDPPRMNQIAILRIRLYKHLHAKGFQEFACAVTKDTIVQILRVNHVCDPRRVKRIVSPNDRSLLSRFENYDVELN